MSDVSFKRKLRSNFYISLNFFLFATCYKLQLDQNQVSRTFYAIIVWQLIATLKNYAFVIKYLLFFLFIEIITLILVFIKKFITEQLKNFLLKFYKIVNDT